MLAGQTEKVGAILTVDGHSATLGDIAGDGFERRGLAALRHLGQQAADPANPHAVLAGIARFELAGGKLLFLGRGRGRQQILNPGDHLRGGQRAVAHRRE